MLGAVLICRHLGANKNKMSPWQTFYSQFFIGSWNEVETKFFINSFVMQSLHTTVRLSVAHLCIYAQGILATMFVFVWNLENKLYEFDLKRNVGCTNIVFLDYHSPGISWTKQQVMYFLSWLRCILYSFLNCCEWARQLQRRILNHGPLTRYGNLRVAHATGILGTFFPPPWVSDPDMHHGTCVTHVPWCLPGSLTGGFLWSRWRKNVPGIPGACATHICPYLVRGPWSFLVFCESILIHALYISRYNFATTKTCK